MHRESSNVRQLFQKDGKIAITSQNSNTGEVYLALFNVSDNEEPIEVSVALKELGVQPGCEVTNMWNGEKEIQNSDMFSKKLSAHSCGLFKLMP
jgi:hypothetical protein